MNLLWPKLIGTLWLNLFVVLQTASTLVMAAREDWPELVLDERIVGISLVAAKLSSLAYENSTSTEQWMASENDNTTGFQHMNIQTMTISTSIRKNRNKPSSRRRRDGVILPFGGRQLLKTGFKI